MPLLGMGIKQAVSYEGIVQCMSGIEEFHVDENDDIEAITEENGVTALVAYNPIMISVSYRHAVSPRR